MVEREPVRPTYTRLKQISSYSAPSLLMAIVFITLFSSCCFSSTYGRMGLSNRPCLCRCLFPSCCRSMTRNDDAESMSLLNRKIMLEDVVPEGNYMSSQPEPVLCYLGPGQKIRGPKHKSNFLICLKKLVTSYRLLMYL